MTEAAQVFRYRRWGRLRIVLRWLVCVSAPSALGWAIGGSYLAVALLSAAVLLCASFIGPELWRRKKAPTAFSLSEGRLVVHYPTTKTEIDLARDWVKIHYEDRGHPDSGFVLETVAGRFRVFHDLTGLLEFHQALTKALAEQHQLTPGGSRRIRHLIIRTVVIVLGCSLALYLIRVERLYLGCTLVILILLYSQMPIWWYSARSNRGKAD